MFDFLFVTFSLSSFCGESGYQSSSDREMINQSINQSTFTCHGQTYRKHQ